MAGSTYLRTRTPLINRQSFSVTANSIGLGVFGVGEFARVGGIISVIGSATVRYNMGTSSGAYSVSSAIAINSGGLGFDFLNYAPFCEFGITANSQNVAELYVYGDVLR